MLEIGSIVDGKYRILKELGHGGMSVVYLAMNERVNKQWAIKEVRKDGVSNYEVVRQGLIAETDMLKKLNHPHLPSIIDVIDGDGTFLIVMDYIEGVSLNHVLKHQGAQSQEDVIEWAKQLCDVLGYLHTREKLIVYRDMKPANVMLKPDGNVTLIDFGTAREFKSTSVADTTCLGTRGYAAPEQFGGMGQTDARTDIYCLGATMYHLVTGHNPAEYPYEMYPIRQWNPRLSSGLEEIIIKCTQKNPEDRYQSCAELMYALEHYRDLENESKKEYNRKWKLFLGSVIMCGVCLAATVGFKIVENSKISDTYEMYMKNAEDATNGNRPDEAIENYIKAIDIDSSKIDPYVKLVDVFEDDGTFSQEENTRMKQKFTKSRMEALKGINKKGYYELMFSIGRMYFYYYESPEVGRSAAGEYFSNAYDNGKNTLNDSESKAANALNSICKYYGKLGNDTIRKDGTTEISYSQYWDDINTLVDIDYDINQDRMTAVKIYEEFYQTTVRYQNQINAAGIDYSEIIDKLEDVKGRLEEIKDAEKKTRMLSRDIDIDSDIDTITADIEQMQKSIKQSSSKSGSKEE